MLHSNVKIQFIRAIPRETYTKKQVSQGIYRSISIADNAINLQQATLSHNIRRRRPPQAHRSSAKGDKTNISETLKLIKMCFNKLIAYQKPRATAD